MGRGANYGDQHSFRVENRLGEPLPKERDTVRRTRLVDKPLPICDQSQSCSIRRRPIDPNYTRYAYWTDVQSYDEDRETYGGSSLPVRDYRGRGKLEGLFSSGLGSLSLGVLIELP